MPYIIRVCVCRLPYSDRLVRESDALCAPFRCPAFPATVFECVCVYVFVCLHILNPWKLSASLHPRADLLSSTTQSFWVHTHTVFFYRLCLNGLRGIRSVNICAAYVIVEKKRWLARNSHSSSKPRALSLIASVHISFDFGKARKRCSVNLCVCVARPFHVSVSTSGISPIYLRE